MAEGGGHHPHSGFTGAIGLANRDSQADCFTFHKNKGCQLETDSSWHL